MLSWQPTVRVPNPLLPPERQHWDISPQERAWVQIDLSAIAHNTRQVKRLLAPTTALMAIVKADAYGHGVVAVAQTVLAAGASWLGVATVPEGQELRSAGITAPILVLGATNTVEQVEAIAAYHLQPTLCTLEQVRLCGEVAARREIRLPVHVLIDTGMSRLGVPWQQATELVETTRRSPALKLAGVYSHFATADRTDPTVMHLQHQHFQQAIAALKSAGIPLPCLHLANSAATLTDAALHYDMVRVGLALYGLSPAPHLSDRADLRPALQVKARITQIKTLAPGTGVSYDHKFMCDRPTTIAVASIGYADGVPRNLTNRMAGILRGQRVPQIGAITMDQLMLDVTHLPEVQPQDLVTLLGTDGEHSITADDWATTLGTISWEILCGFKHRLPRVYNGTA